jgi:hypothetical protein
MRYRRNNITVVPDFGLRKPSNASVIFLRLYPLFTHRSPASIGVFHFPYCKGDSY